MPGYNKTGPEGKGPKDGRRLGYCVEDKKGPTSQEPE